MRTAISAMRWKRCTSSRTPSPATRPPSSSGQVRLSEVSCDEVYCDDLNCCEPDFAIAHGNLGSCYYDLGDFTNAIKSFNYAIQLEPNFADAYNNLGNALKEVRFTPLMQICYERIAESVGKDILFADPCFHIFHKSSDNVLLYLYYHVAFSGFSVRRSHQCVPLRIAPEGGPSARVQQPGQRDDWKGIHQGSHSLLRHRYTAHAQVLRGALQSRIGLQGARSVSMLDSRGQC